ncbi:hypothetical protein SLS58_003967 [Diplodia intermedia]|uniref:Clr5 domain-containing protein n=1 Tax=Diplodia intermedia TaxID=856260 RepID=A0ABR3TVW0_9PEZI
MDPEWERHKETIWDLYLKQDKTLKKVMKEMKEVHNFHAREGKDTDFKINGVPVTQKKLKKAITRYGEGSRWDIVAWQQREGKSQRSPSPYGLSFSTPAGLLSPNHDALSSNSDVAVMSDPALATLGSVAVSSLVLDRLPLLRFQRLMTQNFMELDELLSHLISNRPDAGSLVKLESGPSRQKQYDTFIIEAVHEPALAIAFATNSQVDAINEFLNAVLQTSNHVGNNNAFEGFLTNAVLAMVKTPKGQVQLMNLLSEQNPTFEALIEVIFRKALERDQVDLVRFLLKHSSVHPNDLILTQYHEKKLPLEVAIAKRNFIMVELLINFGADPNKGISTLDSLAQKAPQALLQDILDRDLVDNFDAIVTFQRHGHRGLVQRALEKDIDLRSFPAGQAVTSSMGPESALRILKNAISADNIQIADLIIRSPATLGFDLVNQSGSELVHLALKARSSGMLHLLLKKGVDINMLGPLNLSPLTFAILDRQLDVARYLIEWGACIERPLESGLMWPSPIQAAACTGSYEIALLLISRGANVNASPPTEDVEPKEFEAFRWKWKQTRGRTTLLMAALNEYDDNRLQMVRLLRESGADVKPYWDHAKAEAEEIEPDVASTGHDTIFQYLLSSDPSFPVGDAFRVAIDFGFMQSLRFIVAQGAGVDTMIYGNRTPICYAIGSWQLCNIPDLQLDVVSCLIQEGASLKDSDDEPLKFSGRICRENPDLANLLLQNGACVDPLLELEDELCGYDNDENTVAKSGRLDMAQMLLQAGATVNELGRISDEVTYVAYDIGLDQLYVEDLSPDWTFESTLSIAVDGGLEMVKLILGAGADANEPAHAQGGRTPLQKAAEVGSLDIVDFLLQHDANVNASPASWRGVTALQAAAINSHFDISRRLLERGADPNGPGAEKEGRTALEGAAERGRIDMLQLLLDNGADTKSADFGDEQFRRAVELAEGEGYHAAARLLKRYRDGES